MSHPEPAVTIVLATHRRPDVLRAAVSSVLGQDRGDWHLLVLGDGCGPETRAVVDEVRDERVEYLEMPVRFGEQAGPNSVGIALAETPYIALLNHDDLWLPDHLRRALDALDSGACDFYMAPSAMAYGRRPAEDGVERADFSLLMPATRDPWEAVNGDNIGEPCSAWVLERDLAQRVGHWRRGRDLLRSPLSNWFLRAQRKCRRFTVGDTITVLGLSTHLAPDRGSYDHESPEHAFAARWIAQAPPEVVRTAVLADLARHPPPELRGRGKTRWQRAMSRPLRRHIYRWLGLDLYSLQRRLKGRKPGERMQRISIGRTGAPLPEGLPIDKAVARVRAERSKRK